MVRVFAVEKGRESLARFERFTMENLTKTSIMPCRTLSGVVDDYLDEKD